MSNLFGEKDAEAKPAAPLKPLLAYAVTEEDGEGRSVIVFARHAIAARRNGANEINDGEIRGVTCCRAPWGDAYAESRDIPRAAYLENYWWFECDFCSDHISQDRIDDDVECKPVDDGVGFFCNKACRDEYVLEKLEREYGKRQ